MEDLKTDKLTAEIYKGFTEVYSLFEDRYMTSLVHMVHAGLGAEFRDTPFWWIESDTGIFTCQAQYTGKFGIRVEIRKKHKLTHVTVVFIDNKYFKYHAQELLTDLGSLSQAEGYQKLLGEARQRRERKRKA